MFGSNRLFRQVFELQWRQLAYCSFILFTMACFLFHTISDAKTSVFPLITDEINDSYMRFFVCYPLIIISLFSLRIYRLTDLFATGTRLSIIIKQRIAIVSLQLTMTFFYCLGLFIMLPPLNHLQLLQVIGLLINQSLCFGIMGAVTLLIKETNLLTVAAFLVTLLLLLINFLLRMAHLPSLLFFSFRPTFFAIISNGLLTLSLELLLLWLLTIAMLRKDFINASSTSLST